MNVVSHKSTLRVNSSSPKPHSKRVKVASNMWLNWSYVFIFIFIYYIIWCIVIRPLAVCGHLFIDNTIIISPTKLLSSFPILFQFSTPTPLSTIRHWNTWGQFIANLGRQCMCGCADNECCVKVMAMSFILIFWENLSNYYQTNLIVLRTSECERQKRSFTPKQQQSFQCIPENSNTSRRGSFGEYTHFQLAGIWTPIGSQQTRDIALMIPHEMHKHLPAAPPLVTSEASSLSAALLHMNYAR